MLKKTLILKKVLVFFFLFFSCILCAEELDGIATNVDVESASLDWDAIDATEVVFYVENFLSSSFITKKAVGTKDEPFPSIDDALSYVSLLKKTKKKLKVHLNIRGDFSSTYSYVISCPLKIVGLDKDEEKKEKSKIKFEKNAGFILTSSFLGIENIHIDRKEVIGEPRTVPVFYSLDGFINLKDVIIDAKEGGAVFVLYKSQFLMQNLYITSTQNGYANILESIGSKGSILASSIKCSSRSIIAIDMDHSNVILENTHIDATSLYFNLFARVFDSNLTVKNSNVLAKGNGKKDVAIIYNDKTKIQSENVKIEGFANEKRIKNKKTGYMEK